MMSNARACVSYVEAEEGAEEVDARAAAAGGSAGGGGRKRKRTAPEGEADGGGVSNSSKRGLRRGEAPTVPELKTAGHCRGLLVKGSAALTDWRRQQLSLVPGRRGSRLRGVCSLCGASPVVVSIRLIRMTDAWKMCSAIAPSARAARHLYRGLFQRCWAAELAAVGGHARGAAAS